MRESCTDYSLQRSDGFTLCGLNWPVDQPRATVVIAHGINEHIGRYADMAATLNAAGFSVIGADHRGHGRSAGNKARTSNIRRFDEFVDDYIAVIESVTSSTDGPVVSLGHSMGGLIATRAALRIQDQLAALILSGPALLIPNDLSPFKLKVSLALARLAPFLAAPSGTGGGLSRDPGVREAFDADPLCVHEPIRLGIARQIYLLAEETRPRGNEIRVPLLVMHGAEDTITSPAGSTEFVRLASSSDKEIVIWPDDRHEIFNELDREAVLAKLTVWLEDHFPGS